MLNTTHTLFAATRRAAGTTSMTAAALRALPKHPQQHRLYSAASMLEQWRENVRAKKVEEVDVIGPSQFNLMGNTVNDVMYRNAHLPPTGTELPPAWHLAYFPPRVPESSLSPDGFEQDWKPPAPFTHRMWAGGELEWNPVNQLKVGDTATMVSTIRDIQFRPGGRRGDSVFVWVDKRISNDKGWALTESRCWVYVQPTQQDNNAPKKPEQKQKAAPPPLPANPDFSLTMLPTPITLFRFSALTFNSHLIHYDNTYATEVENHRGCLVHGPLSFMLMVSELNRHVKSQDPSRFIQSFKYRCQSPLVVNEEIKVQGKVSAENADHYDIWVADPKGNMAVKGSAVVGHY